MEREFEAYLKCGRLEHGFLRVLCESCHNEWLVAFSCRKRGFCPKFSLNGALTIGTLDGANIEIRDEVGEDNFFLFGLAATEIDELRCRHCVPWDVYAADSELKAAIDLINRGFFAPEHPDLIKPLMGSLLHHDQYMVPADYRSDVSCQERVSAACRDARDWTRMSILNVARMGRFSSDRAIEEYCARIWHVDVPPLPTSAGP